METEQAVLLSLAESGSRARAVEEADTDFRSLLEGNVASAYRLAAAILGSASDAEDATQDALERAWRARARLRETERFDAWFQRIVVNACRDRIRRRRSTPALIPLMERDAERVVTSDLAGVSAERDALWAALDRLNADQRVVIAMRFYLDLPVDEIARRLRTRSGTVKSRLHRGLEQLRLAWEGER